MCCTLQLQFREFTPFSTIAHSPYWLRKVRIVQHLVMFHTALAPFKGVLKSPFSLQFSEIINYNLGKYS